MSHHQRVRSFSSQVEGRRSSTHIRRLVWIPDDKQLIQGPFYALYSPLLILQGGAGCRECLSRDFGPVREVVKIQKLDVGQEQRQRSRTDNIEARARIGLCRGGAGRDLKCFSLWSRKASHRPGKGCGSNSYSGGGSKGSAVGRRGHARGTRPSMELGLLDDSRHIGTLLLPHV